MMDFLNHEFESETIRRALAGDHEAGIEALRMCRNGLDTGALSAPLAHYLSERLHDVLEGIKPDRALCIAKSQGKPKAPLPDWKLQLAAFAALLRQRGYKAQQIANAMCEARLTVFNRTLDNSDALKLAKFLPELDVDHLLHHAGPYREILQGYLPVK